MKSGARPAGFTIIEVLIVLAVSMAMFLAAVLLISGKTRQTEFSQAARQIQTQLQQSINEVSSGYYTSDGSVACRKMVNQPDFSSSGGAPIERGANGDCIFMGKALQFYQTGSGNDNYEVYTVAGLQQALDTRGRGGPLAPYAPRIDTKSGSFDNLILPYGITVLSMTYDDGSGDKPIGAVAFLSSVGDFGGNDISGQINVVAIPSTSVTSAQSAAQTNINRNLELVGASEVNPSGGVKLCVLSGGTKQSAVYTIGGAGKTTSVTMTFHDDGSCS